MQNPIEQVLEPLCQATRNLFSPIKISSDDYLHIQMDKEGKKFITQATTYRKKTNLDNGDEVRIIDGEEMIRGNYGASQGACQKWQRRCPERKEIGWGRHHLAATDFTALVIHHTWPTKKLIFDSEEAELTYKFLLTRFFSQSKSAKMVAEFKEKGIVPDMPEDFIEHPDLPLSPYQKVGMLCSLHQEAYAYFMEQGTGKTPMAVNRICLEAARKRGKNGSIYRVLIICPKNVRINWQNEFRRFATVPGKTVVARGTVIDRTKAIIDAIRNDTDCAFGAVIMSADSIANTWDALAMVPWDLAILDESHYIKAHTTKRSKAVRKLAEIAKQRMALTGTPVANTVFDLWAQFEFLAEGLSGFSTFSNFRGFHGKFVNIANKGATPVQKLVAIKALPLIQERLSRLSFMINKKEANLGLPDKLYDLDEVEMTSKQADIYRKLATQLIVEIEENMETKELSVDHILTKLLRLTQITSGFVRWDGENGAPGPVEQIDPGNNPKILRTIEMLREGFENDSLGKTVIWCSFIEDIRAISEYIHAEGINHTGYHQALVSQYKSKDAWESSCVLNRDDSCKVFLGNPKSAREGLNILGYEPEFPERSKMYVNHEIYFSSNWSMIERAQSEDRCHRRGTRQPVRITDLVVPGTLDEDIRARVLQKKKTALLISDIRAILRNLV